eukprot:2537060-Pleurochrysis_carterae.AAC.1
MAMGMAMGLTSVGASVRPSAAARTWGRMRRRARSARRWRRSESTCSASVRERRCWAESSARRCSPRPPSLCPTHKASTGPRSPDTFRPHHAKLMLSRAS